MVLLMLNVLSEMPPEGVDCVNEVGISGFKALEFVQMLFDLLLLLANPQTEERRITYNLMLDPVLIRHHPATLHIPVHCWINYNLLPNRVARQSPCELVLPPRLVWGCFRVDDVVVRLLELAVVISNCVQDGQLGRRCIGEVAWHHA